METKMVDSVLERKARKRARFVVTGALRQRYPQHRDLDDDALIERFEAQRQLERIVAYYIRVIPMNDRLDRQLHNAG